MGRHPNLRSLLPGLYDAALQLGLERDRDAVLGGLPRAYIAALPLASTPAAQLLLDLEQLATTGTLADGTRPLEVWLRNALLLCGPRQQATLLTFALAALDHSDPPLRPDLLAPRVAASAQTIHQKGVLHPNIVHPLQPAPYFAGRADLLRDLSHWWSNALSADRIISLVGIGGRGKTATLQQFLKSFSPDSLPSQGLLVWSFYEDPKTEEFLREACQYFGDPLADIPSGRLARLKLLLTGRSEALLVLDGIEVVQAGIHSGRTYGSLTDPSLKLLLRWLAATPGGARSIITSRIALSDLAGWRGAGYHEVDLEDLDPEASRQLLQSWGVQGAPRELDKLAHAVGHHALSVSVLGSYIGEFCGGNVSAAATLRLDDAAQDDAQAAKLARVLQGYATALYQDERDLLSRLSVFPRGVEITRLPLSMGGPRVLGPLHGADITTIERTLGRLCRLGLVYAYQRDYRRIYTAHPFVRDSFRALLGFPPEELHELVRKQLLAELEDRPGGSAADTKGLDDMELLLEHTRLAGRPIDAWTIYQETLRGFPRLGGRLGEFDRGARIVASFFENGDPTISDSRIPAFARSQMLADWSRYAEALGELDIAEKCFHSLQGIGALDPQNAGHFALLLLQRGKLPRARDIANFALEHSVHPASVEDSHRILALLHHHMGDAEMALKHSDLAILAADTRVWNPDMLRYHQLNFDFGFAPSPVVPGSLFMINPVYLADRSRAWSHDLARGRLLWARKCISGNPSEAREQLSLVREWVSRTGHIEVSIRAHLLAAAICVHEGQHRAALMELTQGYHLAEGTGFELLRIELLLAEARVHQLLSEADLATRQAQQALLRSQHAECSYGTGVAKARFLLRLVH